VDFYGVEAKLVIELDGSQHDELDAIAVVEFELV
jgi:very-short-patch-repair endonuclease